MTDKVSEVFVDFSRIEFHGNNYCGFVHGFLPDYRREELRNHLMPFFTGFSPIGPEVAKWKIDNVRERVKELKHIRAMIIEAIAVRQYVGEPIDLFGKLANAS
ncbi:MAG: hypothetical protein ACYDBH_02685 [Acidobacteriaceae bacterium]